MINKKHIFVCLGIVMVLIFFRTFLLKTFRYFLWFLLDFDELEIQELCLICLLSAIVLFGISFMFKKINILLRFGTSITISLMFVTFLKGLAFFLRLLIIWGGDS